MVRIAAISVLSVIVFPATSLANTFTGQKDNRGDQEMLLKRIESLEKEIKILKSLVKSDPAVKPNGSNELASSEFDRNKDFEADFAGSYIGSALVPRNSLALQISPLNVILFAKTMVTHIKRHQWNPFMVILRSHKHLARKILFLLNWVRIGVLVIT